MCSYKTWYYEDNLGYVIECCKCKNLQIGFGNALITFNREEFSIFRKHINTIHERHEPVNNDAVKHIMIPTPCAGLTLLLNTKELNELQNMLELADNEIQADGLMQLFYKEEN
jgi:hypothetical protein